MGQVKAVVLRAAGINCDIETEHALELAGAKSKRIHINRIIEDKTLLDEFQIIVIPGGFSYGDDIAAGQILGQRIMHSLLDPLRDLVKRGGGILGICNGFQVLVKAGILPGLKDESTQPLTLTGNDSGKFECRWVYLQVNEASPCIFTRGIHTMYLPIAHGEGKVVAESGGVDGLNVVLHYADEAGNIQAGYPHNPNGSAGNIAGICDASGRIFALMPHPERFIRWTQHPRWTRETLRNYGDGLQIFLNAVAWVKGI